VPHTRMGEVIAVSPAIHIVCPVTGQGIMIVFLVPQGLPRQQLSPAARQDQVTVKNNVPRVLIGQVMGLICVHLATLPVRLVQGLAMMNVRAVPLGLNHSIVIT
jgi:hypothetical protein